MTLPDIFYALTQLILIAATVLYYERTLESKRSKYAFRLGVAGVLLAFQALYFVNPSLNYLASDAVPYLSVGVKLTEIAAQLLILRLLSRNGWAQILLFVALALLISVVSYLLPFVLISLIAGESVQLLVASRWNDSLLSLIAAVLNITLLVAAAECIGRYIRKQTAELRWSQFAPVIGTQAISLILCTALVSSGISAEKRLITVLTILIVLYLAADVVQVSAFRATVKNSELAGQVQGLRAQREMQRAYYLSLGEQMRTLRRLRHDYQNTLLTMDALIASGDVIKARELVASGKRLLDKAGAGSVYTGNDILDAVLNRKAQEAEKCGMEFCVDLVVPERIPMADLDLMSLFVNLIDNGLTYMQPLPPETPKRMEIHGRVQAGFWSLLFSNAYMGTEPPKFHAQPSNTAEHGHGRSIVKRIVQTYDGSISDRVENGMYIVAVTLNMAATETGKEN